MRRIPLGRSGLEVSILGFGAMHLNDDRVGDAEAGRLLNAVLDLGVCLRPSTETLSWLLRSSPVEQRSHDHGARASAFELTSRGAPRGMHECDALAPCTRRSR